MKRDYEFYKDKAHKVVFQMQYVYKNVEGINFVYVHSKRFHLCNKVEKVYSLEYTDIPEIFVFVHHAGNTCIM
jgi:hypothetical protein